MFHVCTCVLLFEAGTLTTLQTADKLNWLSKPTAIDEAWRVPRCGQRHAFLFAVGFFVDFSPVWMSRLDA